MLIHSIVSDNDIFFTDSVSKPVYENINGGFIEFENGCCVRRIKRLYSTNPYMYLDSRYLPYNIYK